LAIFGSLTILEVILSGTPPKDAFALKEDLRIIGIFQYVVKYGKKME
jgi:hypothetical protein